MLRSVALVVVAVGLLLTLHASATESYEYDALGRLTTVTHDDSSVTDYQYDKAGNRTQVSVTGSGVADATPNGTVVVVPLNGFTVIPVGGG